MRFSRFVVVSALVLAGCGAEAPSFGLDEPNQTDRGLSGARLRLMAGNLTSGIGPSYKSEGIRIFQGCRPDVALVQEFNFKTKSEADIRSFVDQAFGPEFSYARGAHTEIPNGVVSRYPIIAQGDWRDPQVANRAFTWARIDLPGPTDLWAVSVHLLTTGANPRKVETAALARYLQANVPAGDYIVVGGDFNVGSRSEAALSNLSSLVVTSGPYPVDVRGNDNTNAKRKEPYDWVLVSSGLAAVETPTVIGSTSFANGFVADTRVYSPIGDLSPALPSDSAASEMQHMGVVRDFILPRTPLPGVSVQVLSPNGGEVFTAGTVQNIRWSSTNINTVDVAYAADGTNFVTIASALTASVGSLKWPVPASATQTARIRVSDATDSTDPDHSDVSDGFFGVELPASVVIKSPNGGETFTAGAVQTIEWSASGVSRVDIDYAVDGVSFTRLASQVAASAGRWSWSVPGPQTQAGRLRIADSAAASVSDLSDAPFAVVENVSPAQVILNELLANEPNGDTAGEFVELVNVGDAPANLSGWSLADGAMVRHVFSQGTQLAAGATLVIFGNVSAAPAGLMALGASTGNLGLSNSGDSVKLTDAAGSVIDSQVYTSALCSTDGVSMNRSPDRRAGAPFVLHTVLSTAPSSPGRNVAGGL